MNDDELPPLIETPPGRYRHYKGGEYEVLGTARHSETLEPMTLYRALYGTQGLWVRPARMFGETVAIDGKMLRRFVPMIPAQPE
ncbi:MAG: hypothetical protein NVSMB34_09560 [Variovorax sp.]